MNNQSSKLDPAQCYAFRTKAKQDWGRINGQIELPLMLEGLDDSRVLIVMPKQMLQIGVECGWYLEGMTTEIDAAVNRVLLTRSEPGRMYINPEKIPTWREILMEWAPQVVVIPYPQLVGQQNGVRFRFLSHLKERKVAFRISTRYLQIDDPKHVLSPLYLLTGENMGKLTSEMTMQVPTGSSYRGFTYREPLHNWKQTLARYLEPLTVDNVVDIEGLEHG